MKKLLAICIVFLMLLFTLNNNFSNNKLTEPSLAAEKFLTSGLFNKYKLLSVESSSLRFSDGNFAILETKGMETKPPHKTVRYKLILTKNIKGIWKVNSISLE